VTTTGRSLVPDRFTLAIGAAYLYLGVTLGALGPVSNQLRYELYLSGTLTGLHGAMFGWCLLASALLTPRLMRMASAARLFVAAASVLAAGVVVLGVGRHVGITLAGATLMGMGASVLVSLMPPMLRAHHDEETGVRAFVVVNGVSVVGNVVTPLAIAVTLRLGWRWRATMVGVGLLAGAATIMLARGAGLALAGSDDDGAAGAITLLRRSRAVRGRWLVQVLGISVEFAVLIWGAAAVEELGHTRAAYGAMGVGLFSGGMALGRLGGPRRLAGRSHRSVLRWSFAAASALSLTLRFGPGLGGRLVGLLAVGVATALLYPLAFSRMFEAAGVSASAGAVGALASGVAVTFAPLALGVVSDVFGLTRAVLLVPVIALAGWVLVGRQQEGIPPPHVT
jgi:cyanate permease